MRYAKLINGYPHYAPNPVFIRGSYVGNPPDEVYRELGDLPVIYTRMPQDAQPGFCFAETWSETADGILQGWELIEETDVDPAEAMDILFGGES